RSTRRAAPRRPSPGSRSRRPAAGGPPGSKGFMSTRRSRAAAALLVVAAAVWAPAARGGSATLERFTPESGGFALYAPAPALPHPRGGVFFAIVANRLLCTVDAETGEYVTSIDLGLDVYAA